MRLDCTSPPRGESWVIYKTQKGKQKIEYVA